MDLIHLHPTDNVAVATRNLSAGSTHSLNGQSLTLRSDILAMHKAAAWPIETGEAILKYGQVIGFASQKIASGEHVHVHNVRMGDAKKDFAFCKNASTTEYVAEDKRSHFLGYRRANGKVGTRNYIAIVTSVNCSATVARAIAAHFQYSGVMAAYPNVDGVLALCHESGCGMSSQGEGFETLQRTLTGYLQHPNVVGALLVGLGCEVMQVQRVVDELAEMDAQLFKSFAIQDSGGTQASITKGIQYIEAMLPLVNACKREPIPAAELTLALQCGGSDAFSGITANPALGMAADLLVKEGGTVIYSETPEIYGAEHLLTQRARNVEIAQQVVERIHWWESYTQKHGFELNNNPTPGNKVGGITTILEKSLGAQAKSGTSALEGVYLYAQPIKHKGLVLMDSPGFDPVSVTGQIASGANIVCFTTGRGSAFGSKPAPCLKLASNSETYNKMLDDIDINCGAILDEAMSVEDCGKLIFATMLKTASGEKSKSELLGYGYNEFVPWKIGAVI